MKRLLVVAIIAVGLVNLTGCADGPLRRFLRGAPCGAGSIAPGPVLGGGVGCASGCESTCGVDAVYGAEASCGTGVDTYLPAGIDQYSTGCSNCGSTGGDYYYDGSNYMGGATQPIEGLLPPGPAADLTQ